MKSVFLFGAGAEAAYGLKQGSAFSAALLCDHYREERKELLGEDYAKYKLVDSGSQKVFLQTISTFIDEARERLTDAVAINCKEYYEQNGKKKEKDREQIRALCKKWYRIVKTEDDLLTDKEREIKEFFLGKAVFFDSLDEKFNSLRNPELTQDAKRVINAYTIIFLLMIHDLYYLENKPMKWTYEQVFRLLNSPYSKIDYHNESYYSILRDYGKDYEIVTTNYTNIVNQVTGKEVTFLHGNLNWFEDARRLTVFDCTVDSQRQELLKYNSKDIFPFILIPSGVKPIICAKQIEQFHQMIDQLDQTQVLCVVGYRFNSEDNHINSIIADWLRKPGHLLLYFNYDNSLNWKLMEWALEFVRETRSENEIEGILDHLSDIGGQIVNIDVNNYNALKKYKEVVKLLAHRGELNEQFHH